MTEALWDKEFPITSVTRADLVAQGFPKPVVERIALSRHPEATGVKEIQPIVTPDTQTEMWLVLLLEASLNMVLLL